MSEMKNMEELVVSTRQAPAELSYDEVEFLFLNPTPPPPPQPWWKRGGYLKFLLMFTLLISLLALLLPTPASITDYQLSSFPVREEAPTYYSVDSLPAPQVLLALDEPELEIIIPEIQMISPQTPPAPAAAPEASVKPHEPVLDTPSVTPQQSSEQTARTSRMPGAMFSGGYEQFKDKLMLTFTEKQDGPANILLAVLSAEEHKLFKNNEADPFVIKRAAGSLLLYGGKVKGSFDFLPNTSYRESLNTRGWGDEAAPDEALALVTLGKISKKEIKAGGRKAVKPHDQLWFRYFAINVDDDYIGLLRQAGYNDTDLGSLWKLANGVIRYNRLEQLLKLSAVVLTDRPPIEGLADLKFDLDRLKELKSQGLKMTYGEFRKNNYQPVIFEALTGGLGDSVKSQAILTSYARNWSLELPNTVSDTLRDFPASSSIKLKGNFKIKISEDPDLDYAVAYGHKKAIKGMKRRLRASTLKLVNPRRKKTIYLEVPANLDWELKPGKGISIRMAPPKE